MSVQLSSLRVSLEMDGSNYVQGAAAIAKANEQMAASGTLAGAQLAQQDVVAGNTSAALTRLSRVNVDGYASSSQFYRGVASLQKQMEEGNVTTARATTTYTGLVNRFGMVADAAGIAGKGNKDFAAVVDGVNQKVSLQTAGLDKARVGTTQYADQLRIIQGQLVAVAGNLGISGTLLASFGSWGLAAAVGLGAAEKGFELVTAAADRLAGKAQQLNSFGIVTGLTTDQIQVLQETAAHFGLTSQDVGTFVDHFAAQLTTLREATGPLYDAIRKIDPALAQQMLTAKGTATELGLLAEAYRKAGENGPALLKAAGGRTGMADAPLVGAIGAAGGVDALSNSMDKASFLTAKETGELQKLKAENDSLGEHVRNNVASIFSDAVLSNQVAARKELEGITQWMKEFHISDAWSTFTAWFDRHTDGGALRLAITGGAPPMVPNLVPIPEYPPQLNMAGLNGPAPKEDPRATANQYKEMVSALGSAASGYQHLHEKILTLNADLASGKITQDTYNRALAGANTDYTTAAINARVGALGMMANTTDIATQAQLKINKANLEGAGINGTQAAIIVQADLLKSTATKQNTDASFGLASQTDILNQKTAEFLNTANQLNYSEAQRAAGLLVVARNAKAAYESSQVAASAFPQLTRAAIDAQDAYKQFDTLAVSGIDHLADSIVSLNDPTKKIGDTFKALGVTVINELEKMIIKMMIFQSLSAIGLGGGGGGLFGFLGGLFGGGGGGGGAAAAGPPKMANGGVMTPQGSLPLNRYAGGGVANSAQMAIFGEGRTPEAYVPLPDGRSIPVNINVPQGGGNSGGGSTVNISPVYHIDARGSQMTEAQFTAILAKNNKQVTDDITKSLPDRVAAINRDPRKR